MGERPAETPAPDTIGYTRVSTQQQAGEDRTSLADQRDGIRRRASELGRTVDKWFSDEGVSGGTVEGRPGFQSLLSYCETNGATVHWR